jgi:hypothetical protein
MKRSAQLAILVFALVTPAAAADSPAAESAQAVISPPPLPPIPLDPKLPVKKEPPTVPSSATEPAKPSSNPSGNSGSNPTSSSAATVAKQAVAPTGPPDRTPPDNVRALSAKAGNRVITLKWNLPRDVDFTNVVVTRATETASETTVYRGPGKGFVDRHLTNGVAYRYVVVSYDEAGNRSAGVAAIAAPRTLMLVHPHDGATVKAPSVLRWVWVPGATFYNVQLFRGATGIKIMSAWPKTNRLRLPSRWVYDGRRHRLAPGTYRWVVWPGFGGRLATKYGALMGQSTFSVAAVYDSAE